MPTHYYIYAIVHDGARCLVFKKNHRGYFFQGIPKPEGQELHGADSYCLPGGQRNPTLTLAQEAKREFLEETGINLGTATIIDTREINRDAQGHYAGVFFRMATANLNTLQGQCQTNLTAANLKMAEIIAIADQEEKIHRLQENIYNSHVKDNELTAEIHPLAFATAMQAPYFINGNPATGWFYDLLDQFIHH